MHKSLAIAAILLLAGCTTPEQDQRDKLTDLIESRVKLPEGAGRLANYARYYALDDKGNVVGVYAPGYQSPNPDLGCEELLANFTSREVQCVWPKKGDDLLAGQRGWVNGTNRLPIINDGGCGVVTLIYDLKRGLVKDIYCNGDA